MEHKVKNTELFVHCKDTNLKAIHNERAKREVIADAVKTASADLVEVRQGGTSEE